MGLSLNKIVMYFNKHTEFRIHVAGLDSAGKTTIIYLMKSGEIVTTIPSIGFNIEPIEFKEMTFTTWSVGGSDKLRPLIRHYYLNTRAIVFVVDSADRDRVDDAAKELHGLLREDELREIPVLVLANKQDLPDAMPLGELSDKLSLEKLSRYRPWHIQASVATQDKGVRDGFQWLADTLVSVETGNDSYYKRLKSFFC